MVFSRILEVRGGAGATGSDMFRMAKRTLGWTRLRLRIPQLWEGSAPRGGGKAP